MEWAWQDGTYEKNSLYTSVVTILTYSFCLILMIGYRNRGLVTSGVLFNFWVIAAVCGFSEFSRRAAVFESSEEVDNLNQSIIFSIFKKFKQLCASKNKFSTKLA